MGHSHTHDHHHDGYQAPPEDIALRVKALESLLIEKGLVDPAAMDLVVQTYEHKVGPRNGAKVVAKAWVDETGPLGGFDDMATLEDMGLKPTSGEASAADAERCQVPAFAKAIGHEETWKQHNGCS